MKFSPVSLGQVLGDQMSYFGRLGAEVKGLSALLDFAILTTLDT
jgi:hypothetical protein